jgi:hypothetical protein
MRITGMNKKYVVMLDDNFHYLDEEARTTLGAYETAAEALAAARRIVKNFLNSHYTPSMTAERLLALYHTFGPDPWIQGVAFSAWDYADARCAEMCLD